MEDNSLKQRQIAVGPTPILVIRDKRSNMIRADCVRCKGIEDEFPIEKTGKWILGLGCPEVTIRTDVVKTMHNRSTAYDSKSAGHAERHQNYERESSHVDMFCT